MIAKILLGFIAFMLLWGGILFPPSAYADQAEDKYIQHKVYAKVKSGYVNVRNVPSTQYSNCISECYNHSWIRPNGKVEYNNEGTWVAYGPNDIDCWVIADYFYDNYDLTANIYKNTSGGRVFIRRTPNGKKTGKQVNANKVVSINFTMYVEGEWWGYMGQGRWVNMQYFTQEN